MSRRSTLALALLVAIASAWSIAFAPTGAAPVVSPHAVVVASSAGPALGEAPGDHGGGRRWC